MHFYKYNDFNEATTDFKNWNTEIGGARCVFDLKANTILQDCTVSIEAQVYDSNNVTVATFPLESWTKQTNSFL